MNLQTVDTQLLFIINHGTANGLFDVFMPALSNKGYLLILPYVFAMFIWGGQRKKNRGKTYVSTALWTVVIVICTLYLVEWVEEVVKVAVGRERPCRTLEGIRLLVACPKSFSLPSGHAITSFGVALPLFYLTKDYVPPAWRLFPLALATLIAFSRIYIGVHYPTDVLAGAFLGGVVGLGLSLLYRIVVERIIGGNHR